MDDEYAFQNEPQELKKARRAARTILRHMHFIGATEAEIVGSRPMRFKIGGTWQSSGIDLLPMANLDRLAAVTTQPEQWKWHPVKPLRECDCQLLALGIGRFKVTGHGYTHIVSLNFKVMSPPTDTATIPFDPARTPPTLSAEAILDDL